MYVLIITGYRALLCHSIADFTIEEFVEARGDLRVQWLGGHTRAFRRIAENWKGNMGNVVYEDVPVTPFLRGVAKAAATLFGGLDICSVDLLEREGAAPDAPDHQKFVVLEVNDTATGLNSAYAEEDTMRIVELVAGRMGAAKKSAGGGGGVVGGGGGAAAACEPPAASTRKKKLPFLAALQGRRSGKED